jgi:ornithine cyclodeaminase/alanine dehydrogenase-like protein (mu-crystallin family)
MRLPDPMQREEVAERLPALGERIDLVEATYLSLARGDVEMPPKIGVHPRPDSFLHAMPAYLREGDAVALKWVSGFPANPARGLPFISGVIVVNDADTGLPIALIDAAEITAARTAAASGVCIRAWAPSGWTRAAILGCGEQARYHVEILRHLQPKLEIAGYDPVPERVTAMAPDAVVATSPEEAVADADVVITAGPIVDDPSSPLAPEWLRPDTWLLLPIDFDFYVSAAAASEADLFVSDDLEQFEAYRQQGHFAEWPAPGASVGAAIAEQRAGRRVLACNLGVAALDVAFALAVIRAAVPS